MCHHEIFSTINVNTYFNSTHVLNYARCPFVLLPAYVPVSTACEHYQVALQLSMDRPTCHKDLMDKLNNPRFFLSRLEFGYGFDLSLASQNYRRGLGFWMPFWMWTIMSIATSLSGTTVKRHLSITVVVRWWGRCLIAEKKLDTYQLALKIFCASLR